MNFAERWSCYIISGDSLNFCRNWTPPTSSSPLPTWNKQRDFIGSLTFPLAQSEILETLWTNHSQSVKSVSTRQEAPFLYSNASYFNLLCKVKYPCSGGWFFSCSKSSRALTRYQARKRPLEPEQQPPTAPDAPKPGSDSEAFKLMSASRVLGDHSVRLWYTLPVLCFIRNTQDGSEVLLVNSNLEFAMIMYFCCPIRRVP